MSTTYAAGMPVELVVDGQRVAAGQLAALVDDETEVYLRVRVAESTHPALPVAELVLRRPGSLNGAGGWERWNRRSRRVLAGIIVRPPAGDQPAPVAPAPAAPAKRKKPKAPPEEPVQAPVCPYCEAPAVLQLTSAHLYNGRDFGPVWECAPCNAWVGCHKNSSRHAPLGVPANREVRDLRKEAHALFDPLWLSAMQVRGLSKSKARAAAYAWLGERMGRTTGHCHISWMQADELRQAIAILTEVKDKARARQSTATGQEVKCPA